MPLSSSAKVCDLNVVGSSVGSVCRKEQEVLKHASTNS